MAEITEWYITQFGDDIIHLAQQMDNRIWEHIQIKDNIQAKAETFNLL